MGRAPRASRIPISRERSRTRYAKLSVFASRHVVPTKQIKGLRRKDAWKTLLLQSGERFLVDLCDDMHQGIDDLRDLILDGCAEDDGDFIQG